MKAVHLFLFITCSAFYVHGQESFNEKLYDHAKTCPENMEQDVDDLVSYLKTPTRNKKELVEIFFYWMSLNISYDVEGLSNRNYGSQDAYSVLESKKSVCAGYSNLFQELCFYGDIDCEVVEGKAKGFGYYGGEIKEVNHAWNVVKINEEWQLVDVTWGSGYVEEKEGKLNYVPFLNLEHLFPNPHDFILYHLPTDSTWQLLDEKISEKDYFSTEFEVKRLNKEWKAN